jgi:hypothetical protein
MQEKGLLALMLMMAGPVGCLLFGWIGVWGGLLTAGVLYAGHYLKRFVCSRKRESNLGGKWIRIQAEFIDRIRIGRPRRAAQAAERNDRLEALRAKAHLLADICHDSYGAQRCCLEIISQTEKEDPLFLEACDLYMRTTTLRSRRVRDARPPIPANLTQIGARAVPAPANVILFPLEADRN